MMNEEQIELIKQSWEIISKDPTLVFRFYDRLFELAPGAKNYFPDDLSQQGKKLADTLTFLVSNLDKLEEIKPVIEDLGRFHHRLNIKNEYYASVKDALVQTIRQSMGTDLQKGTLAAWDQVLLHVANIMMNASKEHVV